MNRRKRLLDWVERKTGLAFMRYRWVEGRPPAVFLAIGESGGSDCLFEVGVAGHQFCVARWPQE